jgi:hypothetical protein
MTNACEYCTQHNSSLGAAKGIGSDTIEAIMSGDGLDALSPRDRAVVTWCQLVTKNEAKYRQAEFEALREFFNDSEIVELTWISSMFCMINRLHDSLHLDLDSEKNITEIVEAHHFRESDLAQYAEHLSALLRPADVTAERAAAADRAPANS